VAATLQRLDGGGLVPPRAILVRAWGGRGRVRGWVKRTLSSCGAGISGENECCTCANRVGLQTSPPPPRPHSSCFRCHCRMVYLPMSYVYGVRGTMSPTPLTAALREELYPMPYDSIDWNGAR
jgi:hypothetical protein